MAAALAVIALIALTLTVSLMSGARLSLRLGFLQARATEVTRPLVIAAVSALALLVYGRRSDRTRAVALALLAATGILALIALARLSVPFTETGDPGVIEVFVHQALRGDLLLGPYSRYQWRHPGPVYFYLLAPFYWLSEYRTAGLWAGALTINLASLAIMTWTVLRARSAALAVAVTGLSVLYVWRIDALLASQWNPHVVILPTMALIVVCAAVAAGQWRLLPLAALLGTFSVQTHIGLVPTAGAILASALLAVFLVIVRSDSADLRRSHWQMLNGTLWVLAALWFLPLAEEVTRRPGNLARLWQFFVSGDIPGQPFGTAFAVWADMLVGFVRPTFGLGSGGPLRDAHSVWPRVWAVVQLLLLCAAAVGAVRDGRRFHASLAALLVLASLIALWSVSRVEGEFIVGHQVFWITGLGVLSLAVLAGTALRAIRPQAVLGGEWVAAVVCVLLLALAADVGVRRFLALTGRAVAPRRDQRVAHTLATEIQKFMRDQGVSKVRLEIDGAAWDVGAGVIIELEKAATPFAVARDRLWMFGDVLGPTGEETAAVMISTERRRAELLGQTQTANIVKLPELGYFVDTVPLAFSVR